MGLGHFFQIALIILNCGGELGNTIAEVIEGQQNMKSCWAIKIFDSNKKIQISELNSSKYHLLPLNFPDLTVAARNSSSPY